MKAGTGSPRDGNSALVEVARLRGLLAEAQATLLAIRNGEVDAVVVESPRGPQVYTLADAEFDYRVLVESMHEGALVLTRSALILYANAHFALMVDRPLAQVMGCPLYDLLSAADQATLRRLMRSPNRLDATAEVLLRSSRGATVPARVSVQRLPKAGNDASIGMVVSDLTEVRKREDLLRNFSHTLMLMQESERQQVATRLGDNVAQLLCSLLLRFQALADRIPENDGGLRGEALGFADSLRRTADEVRGISSGLRPQGLQILGLASELRDVAAECAGRLGVPIQVTLPKAIAHLDGNTEMTLFRTLQDALRNVEQHARARNVRVTLKLRDPNAVLTIQDDGVGFDVSDDPAIALQAGHFGLLLMRERAAAAGGSLTIRSASGAGTQVRLSVPLSQEPSASA